MNAALKICQGRYDAQLPPPVSESAVEIARAEWLYNATEQLVRFRTDVKFQRWMRKSQGVTVAQLALAVDEHVNSRLEDCKVSSSALGWLLLTAGDKPDKSAISELLGPSDNHFGKLGEIAESLLRPLFDDALAAQAEDDSL
ncbi:hypothetical protein HX776_23500 [Pseudomonas agarici]|uniref:hypothetical protein n=1 Tax=Pseudomonas agarici TaxID=46677 RepID=UPI00037D96B4|nr:hypothetical protein [Pseudomonas agarici]NWC11756.1 hypothetical protein [Pseudomonas agarici]SEL88383.1 hypothetical protein SAMN05216604_1458 [Pseudomonas agarici]SEL89070.1 hypothetical protein SAMN05216604_1477 [Pseudomonas agarici]SEL89723.1 hypothetical protein SAMN05216604_14817 [Pseudomonas agarici]SEL89918.1 hypothetical protein SAMN05216604_1493 [Pseudomonas agarici]